MRIRKTSRACTSTAGCTEAARSKKCRSSENRPQLHYFRGEFSPPRALLVFITMHDPPATPPQVRRRAWTPSPCAGPAWSALLPHTPPQECDSVRVVHSEPPKRPNPAIFFGATTGTERQPCLDSGMYTSPKQISEEDSRADSPLSDLSSDLSSPGIGRAAQSTTSVVDDILDMPSTRSRKILGGRPSPSVNMILHDWAASRFDRPFSPTKSAPLPKPQSVGDENVFSDTAPPEPRDRTEVLRSLAGRLRSRTQGGAMRVPGYVPGDAQQNAPTRVEYRPGMSPFNPSPRRLQRPTRFTRTVPAKRVWDSPEADTQKRKRDDEQVPPAADNPRERLRRRTSLRVTERVMRTESHVRGNAASIPPPSVPARGALPVPPVRTTVHGRQQACWPPTPAQPPACHMPAPRRIQPSEHEVATLTARNTKRNQGYRVKIETRVERMRGARPPSPEPHFCGAHGVVSRKGRQGTSTRHARGAGDEHEYSSPPRLVRCVRWDKALVTSPPKHEPGSKVAAQACLRRSTSSRDVCPSRADPVVVVRRMYDDDVGA